LAVVEEACKIIGQIVRLLRYALPFKALEKLIVLRKQTKVLSEVPVLRSIRSRTPKARLDFI
jgi:hypothetical protein